MKERERENKLPSRSLGIVRFCAAAVAAAQAELAKIVSQLVIREESINISSVRFVICWGVAISVGANTVAKLCSFILLTA